mgnify:FL=1
MENFATLELYFPRNFFCSRRVNDGVIEESPSELVSRNIISIATGIDSDCIIPKEGNNFPDYMANDRGFEVTFAETDDYIKQMKGIEFGSVMYPSALNYDEYIEKQIEAKAENVRNGKYKGAKSVSLCCVGIVPHIAWYFSEPEYSDCGLNTICDALTICQRNTFFEKLYYLYIQSGIFDNIFIVQPTHREQHVYFDIKEHHISGHGITFLDVRNPLAGPMCTTTPSVGITYNTQFKISVLLAVHNKEVEKAMAPRRLSDKYRLWKMECESRFQQLKANEEELNRIFIDIYGLQDELTPEVADKDVTVHRVFDSKDDVPESMKGSSYVRTLHDEIVSLVSYAVGCMFGRYSLDVEGLAFAGGEWDAGKYTTFLPDDDNCIPVTDEEYFRDDIVGRFVEFVRVVYGEDTLEENLNFVANALGNKGNTSRGIIRNYFLNDFITDHIKTYQKRPIYWMFDSGKQNGFKALVYMHRWNADTIGNMRVEYLHRMQRVYESEIARMQETIDNSAVSREVAAAEKRKDKLLKQLKETKDYDAKVAHLALARIDIDLDDGVKVNYEKVQTADGKNLGILTKIK